MDVIMFSFRFDQITLNSYRFNTKNQTFVYKRKTKK